MPCCSLSPGNANDFVRLAAPSMTTVTVLLDLDAHDLGVRMRGLSEGESVYIMKAFFA